MKKYRSFYEKDPEVEKAKEAYNLALKEYADKEISMPLEEFLKHRETIADATDKLNRFLEKTEDGSYRVKTLLNNSSSLRRLRFFYISL